MAFSAQKMQIFGKDFKELFQVSAVVDQIFIKQESIKNVYLLSGLMRKG